MSQEQRIVQISGTARINPRFLRGLMPGAPKSSPRTNAHGALTMRNPPLCKDGAPHTADCDRATKLIVELRALTGE